jgi:hypothetical protein
LRHLERERVYSTLVISVVVKTAQANTLLAKKPETILAICTQPLCHASELSIVFQVLNYFPFSQREQPRCGWPVRKSPTDMWRFSLRRHATKNKFNAPACTDHAREGYGEPNGEET